MITCMWQWTRLIRCPVSGCVVSSRLVLMLWWLRPGVNSLCQSYSVRNTPTLVYIINIWTSGRNRVRKYQNSSVSTYSLSFNPSLWCICMGYCHIRCRWHLNSRSYLTWFSMVFQSLAHLLKDIRVQTSNQTIQLNSRLALASFSHASSVGLSGKTSSNSAAFRRETEKPRVKQQSLCLN